MNIVNWNSNVNTKFYAYNSVPKENVRESTYASGRVTAILQNTRFVHKITCSLRLKVADELPAFWTWYENTLGGRAGAFTCSALGSSYYRFTSEPSEENTDRLYRELKLEIEEVY